MIVKWVPAIIVVDIDEDHECWSPPTVISGEGTTRNPRPAPPVIDPTSVVIRRPSPGLVTDPCPTIGRTPNPVTVTIRRPIRVDIDGVVTWLPDPSVVGCVGPIAIRIEILSTPHVLVVVLRVVTKVLSKITLTFRYPIVN